MCKRVHKFADACKSDECTGIYATGSGHKMAELSVVICCEIKGCGGLFHGGLNV